jgi:hypothetical protein
LEFFGLAPTSDPTSIVFFSNPNNNLFIATWERASFSLSILYFFIYYYYYFTFSNKNIIILN